MARFDYMDSWNIENLLKSYIKLKKSSIFLEEIDELEQIDDFRSDDFSEIQPEKLKEWVDKKVNYIENLLKNKPSNELLSAERDFLDRSMILEEKLETTTASEEDKKKMKTSARIYSEYVVCLRDIIDTLGYDDVSPMYETKTLQ